MTQTKGDVLVQGKDGKWGLMMFIILIGAFMAILDSAIVNVAIPAMMHDYQTTTSRIQWVTNIYMLTLGVVVPTSGWLGDVLGYKKLYIYSLALFTIGSGLCSLAWSENVLIGARVIQALGGGMIMPTTMAMVYMIVPREKIGSAMGLFGISMMVAPAVGPTLGGYLVEYVNWRWIFTINLPVGVIGFILGYFFLPEFPRRKPEKFDTGGFISSATGLFCLLLALSEGQDWGWTSLSIVLLFYVSAAALGIFVWHELTTPHPLLELRVFKYPAFVVGNLMLAIISISMYGGLFYVPYFLQTVRGLGAMTVGLLMLPPALVTAVMMPVAGKLYDRIGPRIPVGLGILFSAIGTYLLTHIDINTSFQTIIFWQIFRSLGIGMTMMPLQTALMSVVPQSQIGRASAITNIMTRVSASFGLAILTLMLTNRIAVHAAYLGWTVSGPNLSSLVAAGGYNLSQVLGLLQMKLAGVAFVQGLNDIFYVTAILTVIAVLPIWLLPKKDQRRTGPGQIMAE